MNESEAAATKDSGSDRRIWLIGIFIAALLIIVAAGAVFIGGTEQEAVYADGSPEAAFQEYVVAWDVGDPAAAYAALSAGARRRVSRYDFDEANQWRNEQASRIWIDERTGTDERPQLRLSIETVYQGGFFGSGRNREDSRVTLVQEDGVWKIDTPLVGYQRW